MRRRPDLHFVEAGPEGRRVDFGGLGEVRAARSMGERAGSKEHRRTASRSVVDDVGFIAKPFLSTHHFAFGAMSAAQPACLCQQRVCSTPAEAGSGRLPGTRAGSMQ